MNYRVNFGFYVGFKSSRLAHNPPFCFGTRFQQVHHTNCSSHSPHLGHATRCKNYYILYYKTGTAMEETESSCIDQILEFIGFQTGNIVLV